MSKLDHECSRVNETLVNPAGNRVQARRAATPQKRDASPRRRTSRVKRHVRITEEEDFDVRLCQANRNGTVCPEGIDQVFIIFISAEKVFGIFNS
jgi:hypothetical protein